MARAVSLVLSAVVLAVMVALVPSSAWPAAGPCDPLPTDAPTPTEEPEPVECVTVILTETATETATATQTVTAVATEVVTQTVVEQGEPTCGSGDLPPCAVQLKEDDNGWLLVASGLVLALLGCVTATLWGRS